MNIIKKRVIANEKVENDNMFWNSTGDEFEYGVLQGIEDKNLDNLTEGNENLCSTCKWNIYDHGCNNFMSIKQVGHDDEGNEIVTVCDDYEKGDPNETIKEMEEAEKEQEEYWRKQREEN